MKPIPSEISRANVQDVHVRWNDGHDSVYPAFYLRLACPCAFCVEETTGLRILKKGDVPPDVGPLSISLVGRYAIHIQWSDGHTSGIYTFEYLRQLCPCEECKGKG